MNGLVNGAVGVQGGSSENTELARAMSIKTNDQLMAIYLSSLIRAITAFHDLIENKIQNKRTAEEEDARVEEEKKGVDAKGKGEEKVVVNGTSKEGEKESKEGDKGKKKGL